MAKRTVEFSPSGIHTAENIERLRESLRLSPSAVAHCSALGRPMATFALGHTGRARHRCDVHDLVAISAAHRVHPAFLLFIPTAGPRA